MMLRRLLPAALLGYVTRLRYPTLLLVAGVLFVLDVIVPDVLPFADELLLGVATAVLAAWKKRRQDAPDPA